MTDTTQFQHLFSGRDADRPFDPSRALNELAAAAPLTRLTYPNGAEGWLATGHATVRTVLSDPRFSARADLVNVPLATAGEPKPAPPGIFIQTDPPEHTRYRHLLTGEFTVRRVRKLTERVEQVAAEHLDAMAAGPRPVDLVTAFAYPIPALVISELLGVSAADQRRFQDQITAMMLVKDPQQLAVAVGEVIAFMAELVAAKRADPADDLLSGLITGGDLDDTELANIAFMLLGAGFETTANMISLGAFALLTNPEQLAVWRADPSLTDNAVEELLRYLSIAPGTVRAALEDVELDGRLIRAGESVTVSISAGNRDPRQFPEPDRLDLRRKTAGHLGFGHGVHQCLGQQLARVEMRVAFPALLRRFADLRLAVEPTAVPLANKFEIVGVESLPVTW